MGTFYISFANQLIKEGLIDGAPLYQFCLGIPWGAAADAETISYMKNLVPENGKWAAFGIGRMQMPIAAESILQGGSIRVGLEDNLYLRKGQLATNELLVDKAASLVKTFGKDIMTPAEARKELNLVNP